MAIGYQLKITIKGSKPPIWRRVIVPEHISFCDLDDIIEKMFGWTHDHLYEFFIKDWNMRITGAPIMEEEDNAEECIDSWLEEGSVLIYTYDFGDNWEHLVKVEKLVEYDERYPVVLKSKGPNMIEDCGGIWGFYDCEEDWEEFDMEAVNKEFATWNLPIAEPIDELIDFEDDFLDFGGEDFFRFGDEAEFQREWETQGRAEFERGFYDAMQDFIDDDAYLREHFGEIQSLQEVYAQFTKDDLIEIIKAHQFTGYSKYKKQELIEWLVKKLLDDAYFKDYLLNADQDEIAVFDKAIREKGIYLSEEMLCRSLFLSSYGGFLPYYNFYNVPLDVQVKYAELMTDEVREQMGKAQYFLDVCHSAIYLYGVIAIPELTMLYNTYAETELSEHEVNEKLQDVLNRNEIFSYIGGYLMDERLEEENLYIDVLKEQEKTERYIPEEKDVFLNFGRNGVQEPGEDTLFFLEYIMKEANLDQAHASLAFYLIQEAIRMNQDDDELLGILYDLGCRMEHKKQFDRAEHMLKKFSNRIRKWDLNGHTSMELNRGIVEFPLEKRV